jgi:hypothetical protein
MDQRSSLEHDHGTGTGPAEPGGHSHEVFGYRKPWRLLSDDGR